MSEPEAGLQRQVGLLGAVVIGLGSIIGTGIFVSVGIAAGAAGPAVILAIAVAAALATCNALNSAQLAASHPVSGGTYEYGYRYLSPTLGFSAGWLFLLAKTASAATAALGFAGYLSQATGISDRRVLPVLAGAAVIALTALVLGGLRRSNRANLAVVLTTILVLVIFVTAGLVHLGGAGASKLTPFFAGASDGRSAVPGFLEACALMFVAYTGYGRIATLGEEVRDPRTTIPKAIIWTLVISAVLYLGVALVAVATLGAAELFDAARGLAAPLEIAALRFGMPGLRWLVALGAITAMLGVLLNLILGLSRVLLAMGRRRDMPSRFARLNAARTTPPWAVAATGAAVAAIAVVGDVKAAWSFSAFTVLIYYAITNVAALRLPREQRIFSRAYAWLGLAGCLGLAFWVEVRAWLLGLALLAVGLIWHWLARALRSRTDGTA